MRENTKRAYIAWSLFAFLGGNVLMGSSVFMVDYMRLALRDGGIYAIGEEVSEEERTAEESRTAYATRILEDVSFTPPSSGDAVIADLSEMMVRLYRDGAVLEEYPIRSKGKPGSLWETPTGIYAVRTKEENHYSSMGNVWMPWSMQFFGNFFIHGWPAYADGTPVPEGFSGGCIRLSEKDAKRLFDFVTIGVPVHVASGAGSDVLANGSANVPFGYEPKASFSPPPAVGGISAFAGDVENGFVFFEKQPQETRSIASLTKMMTALISLEAINQFTTVRINKEDVAIEGDAGGLVIGQELEAGDLLWPLLLASSNDAAYALARQYGIPQFVRLMNEKAKSLGLSHTSFTEPSGLDPANKSTVEDLFRFLRHAWNNKRSLIDITRERSHGVWRNIHPFAAKHTFLGGKTGYIPESKRTIVSMFSVPFGEFENRPVAVVVLGSNNIAGDVERLRLWVKDNFSYVPQTSSIKDKIASYSAPRGGGEKKSFSVLLGGDIMLDRGVEQVIMREGGDWQFPFSHIAEEVHTADIAFANLEGPLSDKGVESGSIYSFRMDPQSADALYKAGFDMVSLANNHIGDWGREALEDTMRRLRRASIGYTGAAWNEKEIEEPGIIETAGRRVGFLAFSDVGPQWLKAGEALSGVAVLPASREDAKALVEKTVLHAKEKTDILVVSFHFGEEYEEIARDRQKILAHAAIDAGARVVAGHHPHVVQDIEEYGNGVIAYSLGNLVFDQHFSEETMKGLMLKIEFEGDKISAVIPIPIKINENFQPEIEYYVSL